MIGAFILWLGVLVFFGPMVAIAIALIIIAVTLACAYD